jgi:membrane-bound serine protease (ClpP class)
MDRLPSRHPRPRSTRAALALSGCLLALSLALAAEEEPPAPGAGRPIAVPAYRQATKVAVLTIRNEVDGVTRRSLERRVRQAVQDGAEAIVLEINTPGGELLSTLDICSMLKDPAITPPNTVAWIHPKAYSAGTIIALACREIVVSPNATFGDAAPIYGLPVVGLQQMQPAERAKIEAPILAEVIDSARRNHFDENLVQSFVSVGVELWLIEHVETGQRIVVDRAEYEAIFGEAPPQQITPVTPARPAAGVTPWFNTTIPQPDRSQGVTLTPEQIRQQIEFQQQLPPSRQRLTESERGRWRLLTQVISTDRLLTVKTAEALYYGLAVSTIADDEQLKVFFAAGSVMRYDRSWSESLVRVLVDWRVRIVLIIILLVCGFIELAVPGFGVFGATAGIALLVLIGAPWLAGMAQWWDIMLIAVGLILVAAEFFLIPGFGVAGVAGALCLFVGLIGTFVTGDLKTAQGQDELFTGIVSTLTALLAAGIGIWLISRQLSSFPLLSRLVLKAEVGGGSREKSMGLLEAMAGPQRALQIGDRGVAETDLRPAGRGSFEGRMVDVQAPGQYIEKGSSIRVISVGRYVIEVEEADT